MHLSALWIEKHQPGKEQTQQRRSHHRNSHTANQTAKARQQTVINKEFGANTQRQRKEETQHYAAQQRFFIAALNSLLGRIEACKQQNHAEGTRTEDCAVGILCDEIGGGNDAQQSGEKCHK